MSVLKASSAKQPQCQIPLKMEIPSAILEQKKAKRGKMPTKTQLARKRSLLGLSGLFGPDWSARWAQLCQDNSEKLVLFSFLDFFLKIYFTEIYLRSKILHIYTPITKTVG